MLVYIDYNTLCTIFSIMAIPVQYHSIFVLFSNLKEIHVIAYWRQ